MSCFTRGCGAKWVLVTLTANKNQRKTVTSHKSPFCFKTWPVRVISKGILLAARVVPYILKQSAIQWSLIHCQLGGTVLPFGYQIATALCDRSKEYYMSVTKTKSMWCSLPCTGQSHYFTLIPLHMDPKLAESAEMDIGEAVSVQMDEISLK